ncbi:MAG: biopolymer transporter ExbD [Polyangiaceae bacterium]
MRRGLLGVFCVSVAGLVATGCDDSPPPKNPFDPPASATKAPPPVTEVPKPKGPPELSIDDLGPKVGFTRVLLDKPEGREKLARELDDTKEHFDGKEATLSVVRKAKLAHVVAMVSGLEKVGVTKIIIKTETRKEYPAELTFTPQGKLKDLAPCTVVGMVLDDRGTAVWKIAGGTASKRAKGFAGPDLTMTGETIERYAKACKNSTTFLVSAAEGIEWGLAYDLAASTKKLEGASFDTYALLRETPIAGRKVDLGG